MEFIFNSAPLPACPAYRQAGGRQVPLSYSRILFIFDILAVNVVFINSAYYGGLLQEGKKIEPNAILEAFKNIKRALQFTVYEYFKDKIRYSIPRLWVCLSFYHYHTFRINRPPRLSRAPRLYPQNWWQLPNSLEEDSIHNYITYQNCFDRTFASASN